jgi:AbiJ N-terminal domain 4
MSYETYEQRRRRELRSSQPDVYNYVSASKQLRHQIGIAILEGIGSYEENFEFNSQKFPSSDSELSFECWETIDRVCVEEVYEYLQFTGYNSFIERVLAAVSGVTSIDEFLSIVEICGRMLTGISDRSIVFGNNVYDNESSQSKLAATSIEKINRRFEQHGVGYQFENGAIVRIDSKLVHAELIKPALYLLARSDFAKANKEFMTSHRHYRAAEYKDSVTAANRAFESILKAICDLEGWQYDKGDRASELTTKVSANGLFTHQFDKGLSTYVAMLKTGLPNVRNEAGGHGEGLAAKAVTAHIARFAINLTASNILFLGDSYDAMKAAVRSAS